MERGGDLEVLLLLINSAMKVWKMGRGGNGLDVFVIVEDLAMKQICKCIGQYSRHLKVKQASACALIYPLHTESSHETEL